MNTETTSVRMTSEWKRRWLILLAVTGLTIVSPRPLWAQRSPSDPAGAPSKIALTVQSDDGTPLAMAGVLAREGESFRLGPTADLDTTTPGYWESVENREFTVSFRDTDGKLIATIEVQGEVQWDKHSRVTKGMNAFLRMKVERDGEPKWLAIVDRKADKALGDRFVLTLEDGTRYALVRFEPMLRGTISKTPRTETSESGKRNRLPSYRPTYRRPASYRRPTSIVLAQTDKPVVVVSVQSFNQLLAHMEFLADAAHQEDAADMIRRTVLELSEGIDKARPFGAVLTTDGEEFKIKIFLPVRDMGKVLETLENPLGMGPPTDVGDGIYRVIGPEPVYVKEVGGWVFLAPEKEHLTNLPTDPSALLDGLEKKYAVAVRGYVQNLSADQKAMALGLIKKGMASGAERQPNDSEGVYAFRKRMLDSQTEQLRDIIDEIDQLTIGWAVDTGSRRTYLDIDVSAVPGTAFARTAALVTESASQFAGFLRTDAALNFHFIQRISDSDIAEFTTALKVLRANINKEMENQNLGEEAEAAAKEVIGQLLDVADSTFKAGKLNGGAVLLLGDRPCFAAGLLVADGQKLAEALRKLVAMVPKDPNFPTINWGADVQGNVRLHTMSIPLLDNDAREVFGEKLEVVVGTADSSIYFAVGKNALTTIKEIIIVSSLFAGEKRTPFEFTISLKRTLDFVAKFAPSPSSVPRIPDGLDDKVTVVQSPIDNGARMRISMGEGGLNAVGTTMAIYSGGDDDPEPGALNGDGAGIANIPASPSDSDPNEIGSDDQILQGWQSVGNHEITVQFHDPEGNPVGVVKIRGLVFWDWQSRIVHGKDAFLSIQTEEGGPWREFVKREVDKSLGDRLVLTLKDGTRYAVVRCGPNSSGIMTKVPKAK